MMIARTAVSAREERGKESRASASGWVGQVGRGERHRRSVGLVATQGGRRGEGETGHGVGQKGERERK
jgi:hypothetical protein